MAKLFKDGVRPRPAEYYKTGTNFVKIYNEYYLFDIIKRFIVFIDIIGDIAGNITGR